jgi:hypothetical protein
MSRNSSGTYTLPAGNPVVTGTTITSTWGNTTMSDIANALTDSLSRSGQGSMQVGLRLFDGTSALPGLTWGTELTSGMYRAGASDYRWVLTTTELLQLTTNLVQLSGTAPVFRMNESDAAANNRLWEVIASGEELSFRALTDALVATNWMTVTRTAGVIDSIQLIGQTSINFNSSNSSLLINNANAGKGTISFISASTTRGIIGVSGGIAGDTSTDMTLFAESGGGWRFCVNGLATVAAGITSAGVLQYAGNEVGYRSLLGRAFSGSDSTAASDNGRGVEYAGAGGHTFTIDSDFAVARNVLTIINSGGGNLTIAETLSGNLFWFNGSGALSTGSRTMAVGGAATIWMDGVGTNAYIWGTGLS